MRTEELLSFYREQALSNLLPFWWKAVDKEQGGIFTCFDNTGARLVSRKKYTWSQGRFVWLWSRMSRMVRASMLPGDASEYLSEAKRTVAFLSEHVFLEKRNCAYVLSDDGSRVEGESTDSSIYADCFVVLGFAEYAIAARDPHVLNRAFEVYDRIRSRLSSGAYRTEPYPIPAGFRPHSIAMILLRISQALADGARHLNHARHEAIASDTVQCAQEIVNTFCRGDGSVWELIPEEPRLNDTVLARHATPGHIFESMWFVIGAALRYSRPEWIHPAVRAIAWAFEAGWDRELGGIFRYIDRQGGKPRGIASEERYELAMIDTWDTKIWWPHSEALFAILLAHRVTNDAKFETMHSAVFDYVFRVFPNPDSTIGEWIQIRDRKGEPLDKCVALPVKDPYHILQDLLLIIELLHSQGTSLAFA